MIAFSRELLEEDERPAPMLIEGPRMIVKQADNQSFGFSFWVLHEIGELCLVIPGIADEACPVRRGRGQVASQSLDV